MSGKRVLVIGGGGREHALAWRVARARSVHRVYVAPGNAGTAAEPGIENVPISAEDIDALCRFALEHAIDLTIVGPEAPLVAGVVDTFTANGLKCFGPTADAARLEGSKAYAKTFLEKYDIPTAAYASFDDLPAAHAWLETQQAPIVVKADGLAAGKGVVVARTIDEAKEAAADMLQADRFGTAGRRIVIEECLVGEEVSIIAMIDGEHILPLASSQDHKRRDAGDRGPNTGGMGAYSPAAIVTDELNQQIMRDIMLPTVAGMRSEGQPYTGFLYAGLMLTDTGPKVLEFNCRMGDPETQPIMFRLESDLSELCLAAIDGRLGEAKTQWDTRTALGVVLAAGGYPGDYSKGYPITGLDEVAGDDIKVFHAGTAMKDGKVVTNGGRVLSVVALGDSVRDAQARAYEGCSAIAWDGAFYRRDIGFRAVARETGAPA